MLKHADIVRVVREPELFTAGERGVTAGILAQAEAEDARKILISMDPPDRRPLVGSFKRRTIANMEGRVCKCARAICSMPRRLARSAAAWSSSKMWLAVCRCS